MYLEKAETVSVAMKAFTDVLRNKTYYLKTNLFNEVESRLLFENFRYLSR